MSSQSGGEAGVANVTFRRSASPNSQNTSPAIRVDRLTKRFQNSHGEPVTALEAVSFDVSRGEIFGLLGPNGAGKTTCLRVLSTVLAPTAGTAEVAGFSVTAHPEAVRSRIGFMSGNTGVYDRMTAREFVEYFGRLYGMEEHTLQRRLKEIFSLLNMNEFRDVLGSKMSTGMKQKTSIARTMIHDPPVMIFDEPTCGLDVLAARTLLDSIRMLRDRGKCIIFSTHIMREVERLCDRIAVIHQGRIRALGTLDELAHRYGESDTEELFLNLLTSGETRTVPIDNDLEKHSADLPERDARSIA